ncbi:hypothetical protein N566_15105 [Streptomycetaceae bacterium MP113-05]|nr:hypothetical protein N566_15105 [Streptomycetaceae bacterium MP113-05]
MTTEQTRDRQHGTGSPPHGRAYIGSFTSEGGRGITTARVDPDDGSLHALHHTGDAVPDPSYLIVGDGVLNSVCEQDDGAVATLSLADPDRPAPLGAPVPVGGAGPTHLARAGGLLCTANYGSGSVSVLPLGPDGPPAGPAKVHRHTGDGPVAGRQEGPHVHQVVVDPSGRYLLAVDLGTDSVWVSALDGDDLRPLHQVPLHPGSGPRHLVFRADGTRVYVVGELEPTLTACSWDVDSGRLEPLGETRVVPPETEKEAFPSEVVLRPDGRLAWVAVRGADSIAVLELDEAGDAAKLVATMPCGGRWPRDLALHPTGRWLYAANERSGDVTWFDIDPHTGLPYPAGALEVPGASCVAFGS